MFTFPRIISSKVIKIVEFSVTEESPNNPDILMESFEESFKDSLKLSSTQYTFLILEKHPATLFKLGLYLQIFVIFKSSTQLNAVGELL